LPDGLDWPAAGRSGPGAVEGDTVKKAAVLGVLIALASSLPAALVAAAPGPDDGSLQPPGPPAVRPSVADDTAGPLPEAPAAPPDPTGEAGPNHYVQAVNDVSGVFNKTGALAAGFPKKVSALWTGFGGPCTRDDGDPIVLYDQLADRWNVSQFAAPNGTAGPF